MATQELSGTNAAPVPTSQAATGHDVPMGDPGETERHEFDGHPVILVVDDDPLLGQVVAACLNFEGAEVLSAHTVAAARRHLRPGLAHIVLDRRLPDGDGLDLLPDLESICPDVPVVVFSAYDDASGPAELPRIDKADVAGLVELLGLEEHIDEVEGPLNPSSQF
jgi:CheY-like chemotaxis protein